MNIVNYRNWFVDAVRAGDINVLHKLEQYEDPTLFENEVIFQEIMFLGPHASQHWYMSGLKIPMLFAQRLLVIAAEYGKNEIVWQLMLKSGPAFIFGSALPRAIIAAVENLHGYIATFLMANTNADELAKWKPYSFFQRITWMAASTAQDDVLVAANLIGSKVGERFAPSVLIAAAMNGHMSTVETLLEMPYFDKRMREMAVAAAEMQQQHGTALCISCHRTFYCPPPPQYEAFSLVQ
jgi:hypothetical protein